ncbi:MAG: M20 family metallopeptidase [Myxococcota bacterium]
MALLDRFVAEARAIRHDVHKHPELGFEEKRTQQVVIDWLKRHGYSPRQMAETGVVADLHPDRVGRGPTIALRADLDALPIQENTPLPYKSIHPGVSHKCGHDGHTSILLATSAALAQQKAEVPGNVRLVFQPAEEGVRGGGARVMIAEGVLEGVDEIYGLHNWPPFPKGCIRAAAGATMAEVTTLEIEIRGKGGHASQPHHVRDPVVAGAQFVTAAQTVVSRGLSVHQPAVLSLSTFHAGTTHNVIPSRAELTGTIRTFSSEVTGIVTERLQSLGSQIGRAMGVEIEVRLIPHYPVLMSHESCVAAVRRVAERVVGPEQLSSDQVPITGGEDFAFYTREIPGAYFFLGAGQPDGETPGCHHPDFDFDDELIPLGLQMFLGLVQDRLSS